MLYTQYVVSFDLLGVNMKVVFDMETQDPDDFLTLLLLLGHRDVDEGIGAWAEVCLYYEKGEWGAQLAPGSGSRIIIDYDHAKFVEVFLRQN